MGIVAAYVTPHPPLIIDAVGHVQQTLVSKTYAAYEQVALRIAAHAPDTIVVISPHAPLFRDCFYLSIGDVGRGDMGDFGAPEVRMTVSYDTALAKQIAVCARNRNVCLCGNGMWDAKLDHASFVPLWFINKVYPIYRLVRIGLSGLPAQDHYILGCCIAEAVQDMNQKVVLVASGDLSHKLTRDGAYGYASEGPLFDREVTRIFDTGNLNELLSIDAAFADAAAECGLRSFQIMTGVLANCQYSHELLSYEGPFGVGYAVAAFEIEKAPRDIAATKDDAAADMSQTPHEGLQTDASQTSHEGLQTDTKILQTPHKDPDPYVALARASIESFVREGCCITCPKDLSPELVNKRAGVFVSLHKGKDLRGCIGTIEPATDSIAHEIIRNGVLAASKDPRFSPVCEHELDYLSYSVDVLSEPEKISSPQELSPERFGVIVTKGYRRGLLLPNLEGVESVEEQLFIAKRKAGIDPFDTDVKLERFEVVRHIRGGEARRG